MAGRSAGLFSSGGTECYQVVARVRRRAEVIDVGLSRVSVVFPVFGRPLLLILEYLGHDLGSCRLDRGFQIA